MNDQQAESDVEEIFSTLEGSVEPNTILKYSSVSCSTEKISKFSDQSYKVVSGLLIIAAALTVLDELTRL